MLEEQFESFGEQEESTLYSPLGAMIRRRPVTVPMGTPLRKVLEAMDSNRIGAIIVIDEATERPRGIFTLQDLLRRVSLKEVPLEQPVDSVMTWNLITMRPQSTGYQAAVMMSRRNVRHLVVTDHSGRLMGIVSQNDLYAIQRAGVKEVSIEIREAEDVRQLQGVAKSIRRLSDTMLGQGVGAEWLTHFISTLNDLLTLRLIELTEREFDLPDVPWCWISLGSEGRFEQTFSTDQDNGIIFDCPSGEAAAVRERFLPFALAVNQKLDECGFPLCKGNIMASNPEWCLSLEEWRSQFSTWIYEPKPEALLNASIFFDFRALYGAEELADKLRDWLLTLTGSANLFLRMMAANALQFSPPIGIIRDFVYDDSKEFPHTIDLKLMGSRLFVDAARIFALASGVGHTGTVQRLRAVAEKMRLGKEDIHAVIEGFYFIQELRLKHQHALEASSEEGSPNRVNPDQLNELDRHVLKEAFKQAKKLQQRLQLDYRI